jgi:hypothetical protein
LGGCTDELAEDLGRQTDNCYVWVLEYIQAGDRHVDVDEEGRKSTIDLDVNMRGTRAAEIVEGKNGDWTWDVDLRVGGTIPLDSLNKRCISEQNRTEQKSPESLRRFQNEKARNVGHQDN